MLLARMVSVARWVVGIPAGMARMGIARYLLLSAVGAGVWCAALMGAGSALGSDHSTAATWAALASLGFAALAITVTVIVRRRRGSAR